ncbi:MAG: methionine aminotransferase [Bacteroidales bacterium]|nr:methionine aminotransferase [Bacteroidales bacterium]
MIYPNTIASKLPNIGTTIFAIMSNMADEHNAINLSRGFPDFNCSDKLISLVNKYMKKGYNQYCPIEGIMPLREAISRKTEEIYSAKYNPETEITITSGATEAINAAITAFVQDDDQVIVLEPAYDCYVPAIKLAGGQPIFSPLKEPDYHIDWDELQKNITPQTKMIILNTPQNPTGTIFSADDMEILNRIIAGTNIIILSDEVYEHIIFDGFEHQSIARYPKLAERSIIVSSFGKTFHVTGWRLGYCIAPENLMKEFRKVHQFSMYTVNTPIQYAIAEYLNDKDEYLKLGNFFQQKRDVFINGLKDSNFIIRPSQGTYFQLLDYSKISDEKDTVFAERLIKEFGVASIPVSVFYHDKIDNKVLRFCFAKKNETLEKAIEKLLKLK